MATLYFHTETNFKNHYSHLNGAFNTNNLIEVHVQEKMKSTTTNERHLVNILTINGEKTFGKTILNLKKTNDTTNINSGNQLLIKGQLIPPKKAYNPNAFDYGTYLKNKQIYSQLYATPQSYILSPEIKKDGYYYASRLRNTIISNLEKQDFDKKSLAIAVALILGQKQDVTPEIMQDFQFAGAIHILSVSGLHVGFILLFLNFILRPFPNTRKFTTLKLVLSIGLLSSFAFIAGLAPSVVRSVTMFCFVAIGYYLRKTTNSYHTIIISLFLILLFEPYFLFDVGFQLSYLALFFILWAQPLLSSLWKPKNRINETIWGILTVSFAAQIGTAPLCLYYFHQFPGLFFITNLILIPFLSFIMILGIIVMLLAAVNYTPILIVKPFEWSINFMNTIVSWVASFRSFVIQDIPFNIFLLVGSYACIFTFILWLKKPNYQKLVAALIAVLLFQLALIKTEKDSIDGEEWIVFHQNKSSLITERKGKEVCAYYNSEPTNTSLKAYLTANFSTLKHTFKLKNLYFFDNQKILIIDSTGIYPKNARPDVLVLTQSPTINLDRTLQRIRPKIVIADGSNYKTIQKNWEQSCAKQKIPFHATAEKGFYKLN
ncbi:competence protein ComEC [Flavobacterium sp. UMI-01]|nr:competence protein ComEC [Flavobacterium sp. UMI-01]